MLVLLLALSCLMRAVAQDEALAPPAERAVEASDRPIPESPNPPLLPEGDLNKHPPQECFDNQAWEALYAAAYKADADTFPAAYASIKARADRCQQLWRPIALVDEVLSSSRATLNSAIHLIELATDEVTINALSAKAKQSIPLATAAYGALAASSSWGRYDCSRQEGPARSTSSSVDMSSKDLRQQEFRYMSQLYCDVLTAYGRFNGVAAGRRGAAKSLCGGYSADGKFRPVCLTYGLISAAVSYIWKIGSQPAGVAGSELLSLLVPYGGMRITPSSGEFGRFFALDINLYSAFLTTKLQTPEPTPCIANGNALERALHCETRPSIHPFAAVGIGMTIGEDKIGYFSLVPLSIGVAQFGAQGIHPFIGGYASILQLTGRF